MWDLTHAFVRRAARTPALSAGACLHVSVSGVFVLFWPDGLPVSRSTPLEQLHVLQAMVLCVVLPWTATRAVPSLHERDVTSLAVASGTSTWIVLSSAVLATLATVVVVATAGIPARILAQQFTGTSVYEILTGSVDVIWIAAIAALASRLVALRHECSVTAWGLTTAITAAAATMASGVLLPAALSSAAAAIIGAASLLFLRRAAQRTIYLREEAV
jgi:hypothetical protein